MLETPIVLVMLHKEEIQETKVKVKVGECIFLLSLAKFVGVKWIGEIQLKYDTGEYEEKKTNWNIVLLKG